MKNISYWFPTSHFCYFLLVIYINADFDHLEKIMKAVDKKFLSNQIFYIF